MHPDYRSASCDDVARRVDECISLRAQLQQSALDALSLHGEMDALSAQLERTIKQRNAMQLSLDAREGMLSELVAEAKALCDIDYCFGEADRQAKERRAWVLISKLSRAATPTPSTL